MEMNARVPGPRALPVMGGMLQLRGDPLARIVGLRARYGGFVRLGPLRDRQVYLLTDPAGIKHVLADNSKGYKKGLAAQRLRPILGLGSLLLEGDAWRRRRRLIQPAFHKQKVATLADSFVVATDQMLARWQPALDAGASLDARDEMLRLTMTLTLRNMFGADESELRALVEAWQHLYAAITESRTSLVRLPAWVPSRRRERTAAALAAVRRVLDERIRARAAATDDDGTVLSMLVRARDDDGGAGLTDVELRDEVMTVFVGGYETSSNALAFTLASLAAHPDVGVRHREELDRVLAGRAPGIADLASLPYNRAILEESLRLYPPSWMITREALAPDAIAGYPIARGDQILISSYGVHHAADLWPDPERFAPERHLADRERSRFAFLPFGGGPRVCLGDQYAMTEMQLVLARLGQAVSLRLAPGTVVEPEAHVGLRPRHPLRLVARAR